MVILSVCFLWRTRTRGREGEISLFSLAHGRWRSRPGQLAQAARPNVRVYGTCAVCRCVLVRIMAAYIYYILSLNQQKSL